MFDLEVGKYLLSQEGDKKREFEITKISPPDVTLKDTFTGTKVVISIDEINEQIFLGKFELGQKEVGTNKICYSKTKRLDQYSETEQDKAIAKYLYVKAVLDEGILKYSPKTLNPIIKRVSSCSDAKAPVWRTLIRWLEKYAEFGIQGLVEQHSRKGNKSKRLLDEQEERVKDVLEYYKKNPNSSIAKAHRRLTERIRLENIHRSDDNKLEPISYTALVKRVNKISEYDLLVSRGNKELADKRYKQLKESSIKYVAKKILDKVEIDHTTADLFVVAEKIVDNKVQLIPLGRPKITLIIDWYSKSILGFHICFQDPSYASIASAIKCAISDKSALLEKYPSIKGEWICRGKFKNIAFDNGKDFRSTMLRSALHELQVTGSLNKKGHPWNKGSVESFFRTLNEELLQDLPGSVSVHFDTELNYDPQKNAVIKLSTLREIFTKWVVEVYQELPISEERPSPNVIWRECLNKTNVTPVSPAYLTLLMAEPFEPKNGYHGIQWNKIKYDSEKLKKLRQRDGYQLVKAKLDRDDLGEIWVFDELEGEYFKVEAVNRDYAKGLSLTQHKRFRKMVKELVNYGVPFDDIAQAKVDIFKIAIERMTASSRVKSKQRAAILLGFGKEITNTPLPPESQNSPETIVNRPSNQEKLEETTIDIDWLSQIEDDIPEDYEPE